MDNPSLLTVVEQQVVEFMQLGTNGLLTAQDKKTAAIMRAATLRAVGEAFQERAFIISSVSAELDGKPCVALEQSELTALRNGQWPAGWEKE